MKKRMNKDLRNALICILILFALSAIFYAFSEVGYRLSGGYKSSPYFSMQFTTSLIFIGLFSISSGLSFLLVLYIGIKQCIKILKKLVI